LHSTDGSLKDTWIGGECREPLRLQPKVRHVGRAHYVLRWIAVPYEELGELRIPTTWWTCAETRVYRRWPIEPRRELMEVGKEAGAEVVCETSLKYAEPECKDVLEDEKRTILSIIFSYTSKKALLFQSVSKCTEKISKTNGSYREIRVTTAWIWGLLRWSRQRRPLCVVNATVWHFPFCVRSRAKGK
jgi:hypothetical protein